jgi:hypothetical protein
MSESPKDIALNLLTKADKDAILQGRLTESMLVAMIETYKERKRQSTLNES